MFKSITRRGALAMAIAMLPAMGMAQDVPKFFKIVSTSPGGLWHTFGTQLADKLGFSGDGSKPRAWRVEREPQAGQFR